MNNHLNIDREFYGRMVRIAAPIMLQQAITSSLALVDTMLVGQLGDASVAGVALANQVYFILNIIIFGLSSGSSIFIAQFWGNNDVKSIRKVMGISLCIAVFVGLFFSLVSFFSPRFVLGIFSKDPKVIEIGAEYLQIVSIYFVFYSITLVFSTALRSTRHVHLPMAVSGGALILNTSLGYLLIFGKLGFPALGVKGAAIAMLIARLLEFSAMVGFAYIFKSPAAASIKEMFSFDLPFAKRILNTSLPVVLNEAAWGIGVSMYSLVYARMGTDAIAAANISTSIENLMYIPFQAFSQTSAIMIGNLIGAGYADKAYFYAKKFLRLTVGGGMLMGVLMFFLVDPILGVYQISATTRDLAHMVMIVLVSLFWVKASNTMMFVGVLRAGGDTHFALILEIATMWFYGVPTAFLCAFVFHLPVYWVVFGIATEEILKFIIVWWRFLSTKWIHHLANIPTVHEELSEV